MNQHEKPSYVLAQCAPALHNFATSAAPWLAPYLSEGQEYFVVPVGADSFDDDDEIERFHAETRSYLDKGHKTHTPCREIPRPAA